MGNDGMVPGLDGTGSVLHVVARKQGNPPAYYYRRWIGRSRWTAWTKIDLDIVSDHILPIVWNRRFYIFWAIINRKPDKKQAKLPLAATGAVPEPARSHLEVQLAWSEFKGKRWLAKQIAPQTIVIRDDIEPHQVTLKSTISDPLLHITLFVDGSHYAEFVLGGVGNAVEAFVLDKANLDPTEVGSETRNIGSLTGIRLPNLLLPGSSNYEGMAILPKHTDVKEEPARQRVYNCNVLGKYGNALLLQKADFHHLLVPHQTRNFDSTLPFFYEDGLRSYFVIPNSNANAYTFIPFYHAFVPLFIRELNRGGIDSLYSRELQVNPTQFFNNKPAFDSAAFSEYYLPQSNVTTTYTAEGVDFGQQAGYSIYNWELFFHAPFHIGESLSRNQRFEDAKHWYEYIFNPTSSTKEEVPKRYWITKEFYNMTDYQAGVIQNLMKKDNYRQQFDQQIKEWRENPFDPHVIAGLRRVAYQRTIVMKYIDNLIAWGDQLFNQDTMESINEAIQMYVLAAELLGPQPEKVKPLVASSDMTYEDLEGAGLDAFANAKVLAAENLLGPVQYGDSIEYDTPEGYMPDSAQSSTGDPGTPKFPLFPTLYFTVPPNEQLLRYWDTVADRLFKIRHCMNIGGVKRELALFAPPIDPGLLVRAAAAGLDLGSIINDNMAALPPYRFRVIVREAIELCEIVRSFGNELLSVLEKRDVEALALLRSGYERKVQDQIGGVLKMKVDETGQQLDVLEKQRLSIEDRKSFYNQRKNDLANTWEAAALVLQGASLSCDAVAMSLEVGAIVGAFIPNFQFGGSGAGGSPHATMVFGGSNIASASSASSNATRIASAILQNMASTSQTLGSYHRRKEDWGLQYSLATDELTVNNSQSLVAAIAHDIAQKELDNHATNVELATKVDEFLHAKYSNKDLYDWMISQTSATYFQTYQMAYSLAKQAEKCYRQELGLSDSSFIQFGYWDSLKKGLLSGDKLLYDLQRMKSAYHAHNARELELTKHISLLSFDPYALVELRTRGECVVSLPELLFDLDNPGHFMRRIKSVGITVPCVTGPYTGVSMTLTLLDNHVRTRHDISPRYARSPGEDLRFFDDQGGISAIVTSNAQNDRGMFELRLDDERYLPFEYGGAVSSWKIRLNPVYPQFDYSTISDAIIHMQYTAKDGGDILRTAASQSVRDNLKEIALAESRTGLYLLISARHEFGSNWQKFLNPLSGDQVLAFDIAPDRFPFFTHGLNIKITGIDYIAKLSDAGDYILEITPPGGSARQITMSVDQHLGTCHVAHIDFSPNIDLGSASSLKQNLTWVHRLQKADAADFHSLAISEIDDLICVVQYRVEE
jgi:hypothetical protein